MDEFTRNYLSHHGILGQKWGVRRFQNKDGSLTNQGKRRYRGEDVDLLEDAKKHGAKIDGPDDVDLVKEYGGQGLKKNTKLERRKEALDKATEKADRFAKMSQKDAARFDRYSKKLPKEKKYRPKTILMMRNFMSMLRVKVEENQIMNDCLLYRKKGLSITRTFLNS